MPHHKKRAMLVFLLIIVNGLIDILGLAFILPVIYLANDPTVIHTNDSILYFYELFGFASDKAFLTALIVTLFVVFLLKNITGLIITYIQSRFAFNVTQDLLAALFSRHLNMDLQYYRNTNSNYIIRDIVKIPMDFSTSVLVPFLMLSNELVVILFIATGIAIYNFSMFLVLMLVLVPVVYLFYRSIKNKIARMGHEKNEITPMTHKSIFDAIRGYVDVKIANKEQNFINQTKKPLSRLFNLLSRLFVYESSPIRIIEMSAILGIVLIFMYSIYFAANPNTLVAFLIIFATAAYRLMPSLNRILNALIKIRGVQYVYDVLLEDGHSSFQGNADFSQPEPMAFNKSIVIKDLSFTYPDKAKKALNKINFEIKKGSVTGFIGKSGGGKSTLLQILLRFYEEQEGSIRVDGVPLTQDKTRSWHSIIGYVQQDFYMLDATLAENIAFGDTLEEIDWEKLNKCVKQAQLEALVNNLPDGVRSQVGEFGGKVSGGQRQRIAIARALYKEAKILLFDEATSALDSETEKDVMSTIYNLAKGDITLFIVAHRHSTLKNCEVIYELHEGDLVNKFTYSQLMSKADY
jgi:ABC-type bacteriocin/lantibiotic exporter with double-glycine peptidase domain